jgi:MoaA/NifB/PqqE/SkfB family radical SAM enzyme
MGRELFPYAREVLFCSGGEPLLYPKVREALQFAANYRLSTCMVSNGMLLTPDVCDWIVDDQTLGQYVLSFDGATRTSVETIRRGASFDRIIANMTRLFSRKQDAHVKLPQLGLRYSVMRQNVEELPKIFELCKIMGVSTVEVSYVTIANEMNPNDSLYYHQDLAAEVFKEAKARAKEQGISVNLPPLPRDDHGGKTCDQPWRFVQLDTDGSIRFCYRAWIQTVGNVAEGFHNVWRGYDYRQIRKTLDSEGPYFPYCAFCSMRNGINSEVAHNQKLHADAYTFRNGKTRIAFNRRTEENSLSFQSRERAKQGTENGDPLSG